MCSKENKISQRIILSLIASIMSMSLSAQTATKRPSLVVGIMINDLNQEYIDQLQNLFCDNGFNFILKNAVMLPNVDYGTTLDITAATAMIYSGSAPSINGISHSTIYNPETLKSHPILLDPSKIGNYTDETYSPSALLVSTITDEIKIDGDGLNQVHSIAPNALQSIVMAGHASNSAFWINDISGKWATTTYYKDVPNVISLRNYKTPLSLRLDTLSWTPTLAINDYPDVPDHRRTYPFRYTFPSKEPYRYKMFKESACVNNEVTSIATDYISSLSLGKHQGVIDMLNIAYTLTPYQYTRTPNNRVETMDSYIKLDRHLAQLFASIERNVGMENTLIFIAGTPSRTNSRRDDEKWNIPYGQFSTRRAISLLNMYLMAKHGNGEWVKGIHENNLYLNHKIIKDKSIDIKHIRQDAAIFLTRMSGISSAFSIDDIIAGNTGDNSNAIRRNTNIAHSGDVIFTITPGWSINTSESTNNDNIVTRVGTSIAPVFILAPSIKSQTITQYIDVRAIAPTVARLLRIRSPNSASIAPLHF